MAAVLVPAAAGLLGLLVLANPMRHLAGEWVAGAVLIFVSFYPTFVTYEHAVLTETGTYLFFAVACALTIWNPRSDGSRWLRAVFIALVLGIGFYWRQNLLYLVAPAAALTILREWRRDAKLFGLTRPETLACLGRVAIFIVIPYVFSKPWDRVVPSGPVFDTTLKQGTVRQALLPPDDPYLGPDKDVYIAAIRDSMRGNNFYSGVTWPNLERAGPKVFEKPIPSVPAFFLHLVLKYPMRYLSCFGRSILFFSGIQGVESDNRSFRDELLSPAGGAQISEGPEPLDSKIKADFQEHTSTSLIQRRLRRLAKPYDFLLPIAVLVTFAGLVASIFQRNIALGCFCLFPLFYLFVTSLWLVTIDRFMVPVYPVILANLLLVPGCVWKAVQARRGTNAA